MEIPREHRTAVIAENPSQRYLSTRPSPVGLDLEVSACQSEVRVCIPAWTVIKTYCANCIWAKVSYKFTFVFVDYIMHCPKSEETEISLKHQDSETLALSEHKHHFFTQP